MKPAIAAALFLVLLPVLAPARKKPGKPALPAVFEHAQYVYVEAMDGNEFNPNLYPEDRQAIADVEAALRHWKRYTLTIQPSKADLVIVVRRGRLASGRASVGVNAGPGPQGRQIPGQQQPVGTAVRAGAETGPGTICCGYAHSTPPARLASRFGCTRSLTAWKVLTYLFFKNSNAPWIALIRSGLPQKRSVDATP